ncbi:MAG TPA: prolyl oligopeptidase family serine peptidase [Ignavibacteria bacterium]|nr:prolyl oligopeptidase family serine peptidase [Ignavibacteria bacterium]
MKYILIFLLLSSISAFSQDGYKIPDQKFVEIIDAPFSPVTSFSPDNIWMAILERTSYPPLEEISQTELKIAGIRFNPKNYSFTRAGYYINIKLVSVSNGNLFEVQNIPQNGKIRYVNWSGDSKYIVFTNTTDLSVELWIIDVESKIAEKLSDNLNSIFGKPYEFLPDNKSIVILSAFNKNKPEPVKSGVPETPIIQENYGKSTPVRTFQDLLKNSYDEDLFDHFGLSQPIKIDIKTKNSEYISTPAIYTEFKFSPDGNYILSEKIKRPYSYLFPYYYFPKSIEILDKNGNLISLLADIPLSDEIPTGFDAVRTGKREFDWRQDAGSIIYWAEAQDGGNPKTKSEIRDKVYQLSSPFNSNPEEIISLSLRYEKILWSKNNFAIINERWWNTRKSKFIKLNLNNFSDTTIIFDLNSEDRYNNPGEPYLEVNTNNTETIKEANSSEDIFLTGVGASAEGNRPFLDVFNLNTKISSRIWRSEKPYYERIVNIKNSNEFVISSESQNTPQNYILINKKLNNEIALTNYSNPYTILDGITKEIITYKREDGVELNANLYLPKNYDKNKKYPVLMWAYPQEFKSSDAAGQITDSPYRFNWMSWGSPLFWLTKDYVILDNPKMPIIGEGDSEPNDKYVEQLIMSAKAAVDEMIKRGISTPDKMAIGGHSYGAFMTANLLAHSDLFKTGIARSGAYNRTLTPFGFQSEQRTLWEAPETYLKMSPFMYANKINEPILIIHGEVDNNSGTFPLQSERLYNAIKGHGGTSRYVVLPYESHGYSARESVLHMLWEMDTWLEKFLIQSQ